MSGAYAVDGSPHRHAYADPAMNDAVKTVEMTTGG